MKTGKTQSEHLPYTMFWRLFSLRTAEYREELTGQIEQMYKEVDSKAHKIKLLCMYYALTEYSYD